MGLIGFSYLTHPKLAFICLWFFLTGTLSQIEFGKGFFLISFTYTFHILLVFLSPFYSPLTRGIGGFTFLPKSEFGKEWNFFILISIKIFGWVLQFFYTLLVFYDSNISFKGHTDRIEIAVNFIGKISVFQE